MFYLIQVHEDKPDPVSVPSLCVSEPEDPPTGISTIVTNSTVRVHWNEAKKIRGLLLGYKVLLPLPLPVLIPIPLTVQLPHLPPLSLSHSFSFLSSSDPL